MLYGLGQDNSSTHKFILKNDSGQPWNGTSYETWDDTHFSLYGITATRLGTTISYTGIKPVSATVGVAELWEWTGTLSTSYPVYSQDINTLSTDIAALLIEIAKIPKVGRTTRHSRDSESVDVTLEEAT